MLQGGDVEIQLKKSVEKIQELNAEVSAARQDNLQLKVRLISQLHRRLLPNYILKKLPCPKLIKTYLFLDRKKFFEWKDSEVLLRIPHQHDLLARKAIHCTLETLMLILFQRHICIWLSLF